jgi:hypothetical protein
VPPSDRKNFELPFLPENGRIMRYLNEFQNCKAPEKLDTFMNKIFRDSMKYLKNELGFTFPEIRLTYYYRQDEYDDLIKRLDKSFGKKPYTKAMVVGSPVGIDMYINVIDHWSKEPANFIVNLCISFIEELVHVIYPMKSETHVHDVVCAMVEEFIEVKLPDDVKAARLKYSKEFDGSK